GWDAPRFGAYVSNPPSDENVRVAKMADDIMRTSAKQTILRQHSTRKIELGQLVIYSLSPTEKSHLKHTSGETKYSANWSLPHRVVRQQGQMLTLKPVWFKGEPVVRSLSTCK